MKNEKKDGGWTLSTLSHTHICNTQDKVHTNTHLEGPRSDEILYSMQLVGLIIVIIDSIRFHYCRFLSKYIKYSNKLFPKSKFPQNLVSSLERNYYLSSDVCQI